MKYSKRLLATMFGLMLVLALVWNASPVSAQGAAIAEAVASDASPAPGSTIKDGTILTAVRDRSENTSLPEDFALGQNFPNPFLRAAQSPALSGGNPETAISFELPEQSEVVLAIFNLVGQKVKTLVNGNVAAGRHTIRWNGTDESGRSLTAGVYIYRMQAARNVYERKMILLQ